MTKAIFFDNGGVLCQEGYTLGVQNYEKEFNIPKGEFYKIVHDHQGWEDFTLGLITQAEYLAMCQKRAREYFFNARRFIELINEATVPNIELINYIKQDLAPHYNIGIISNNSKEVFESLMKKVNLDESVKYKIVSCYIHERKPDKKMFQIALAQAGIQGEESIYVDDRPDRIDGAKESGMRIIIYKNNFQQFKEELAKAIH
ncbi:MAG: hypothetical protein UV78_C0021G0021 [Parcubacteria group bacterium GW2011_GWA2_43_17]|nr:MAG: hypothetical protein UV78_C0021G0021 [Parcubacteria group bacterium GW2011_GWA2_43_17]KKT93982.1 MAG: hypothetical protein UW91_C0006G0009 [Parcubacteria group bacterium GW2011_GWF2_45_11]HBV02145.1 hypothetical protein [Candidatus Komeilibacteria bacterium]